MLNFIVSVHCSLVISTTIEEKQICYYSTTLVHTLFCSNLNILTVYHIRKFVILCEHKK